VNSLEDLNQRVDLTRTSMMREVRNHCIRNFASPGVLLSLLDGEELISQAFDGCVQINVTNLPNIIDWH
jgi:hypothetical protein